MPAFCLSRSVDRLTLVHVKKSSGSSPPMPSQQISQAEENEPQLRFLLAALQDTQTVIRATDSKVAALSFGLAVPLTKLGAIWAVCDQLLAKVNGFAEFCAGLTIFIFAAAWLLSVAGALRTLLHVDNPAKHIGGDIPSGAFYSASLFQPSLVDLFFPRRMDATTRFTDFFGRLPTADRDIRRELAFELMKVVYIRTIKLRRASLTYAAFSAWLVAGGGIWITALILRYHGS
jgi:hypothetical protein